LNSLSLAIPVTLASAMLIAAVAAELFEPLLMAGAIIVLLTTISLVIDSVKGRKYALVGIALESLGFSIVGAIISPVSLVFGVIFMILGAAGAALIPFNMKRGEEKKEGDVRAS